MKVILKNINLLSIPQWSKQIISIVFLVCLFNISIADTRISTSTGGNWNSASTWIGGVLPLAGDNVIIATNGTGLVIVDGLITCADLTINSRARLIILGTNTLNVNGNITMPRPGSGSSSELNVNEGTLNVMGSFTMGARRGTGFALLNITSGTANLSDFSSGGTASKIIFKGDGILNLSGNVTGADPALDAGSGTINFNGTSNMNLWAKTYHNLGIAGSGTKNLDANTTVTGIANINGKLNLSNHNLILTGTGNPLVVGGTLATSKGDVVYAGEHDQIIASIPYFHLSFIGAGTKKILAGTSVLVEQDWLVDSPTLLEGDSRIEISRDMRGTGALEMENGFLTIGGNNLRTGTFNPGSGTVQYSRDGDQKIRTVDYFNLSLTETGEKSISNGEEIIINNDLDVSSPFMIPGNASVNVRGDIIGNAAITLEDGSISIAGDWMNEADFESGNSTIIYDGNNDQIIAGNDYFNLETAEGGIKSLNDDAVVRNVLTVGADTELYLDSNDLTLSGSGKPLENNGTFSPASSTVYYTNAEGTEIAAENYHNLDAVGGPRKLSDSGIIGVSGTFRPGAGDYTIMNSTVSFNGVNQTIPQFTFYNVILTGGGNKLIDSLINVKKLILKNGSNLIVNPNNGAKIVVIE